MKATLITRYKDVSAKGHIVEMVIWHIPEPVPPAEHHYKYRLVYIVDGQRVIGFDNERGKGDHYHIADSEWPYEFAGIEQLVDDFLEEVERWDNEH